MGSKRPPPKQKPTGKGGGLRPQQFPMGLAVGLAVETPNIDGPRPGSTKKLARPPLLARHKGYPLSCRQAEAKRPDELNSATEATSPHLL